MTSRPIVVKRPYTVVAAVTLGLVLLLGAAGTLIFLAGLPLTSPVPLVFTPVLIGLIVWISVTKRWGRLGFRLTRGLGRTWLSIGLPMIAVLLLVVTTANGLAEQTGSAWVGLVALVALVAVVEETIFRSLFLAILSPKGLGRAVIVSSIAFALAHSANLLGGQSLAATIGQVGFAVAFGLFTACAYLSTGSIWPAIVFHALFNAVQLGSATQTLPLTDAVMTAVLLAGAGWLWVGIRRRELPVGAPSKPRKGPQLASHNRTGR